MSQGTKYIRFSVVSALVVLCDQITKALVLAKMPLFKSITIIPGFFNLTHVHNRGGAFGFLAQNGSPLRHWIFLGAAFLALGLILYFYHQTPKNRPYLGLGLSLIFGGAIGNVIDRLRFGEVVDFLDFYVANLHWPTFNVADSAVTVGVGIFLIHIVFRKMPF
ncbi:MAG: signal peptidase II [Desulfobacteraceae bacterium]|jgi:signal peptidase II